mgnify:CR=1 FL=1
MAEAVFRHPKGKAQRRIASAGVQGFAEHRQDMGADIEDHPSGDAAAGYPAPRWQN